jgi:DNA-binding IclR family transcriptional regulator|uniref:helix-turn-helix domain-containing protein n=1 Tax=Thermococcus nautili TaxID=195522 RepID=UPI0018686C1C|nr:helix-turn-helix domain-containing protein [Thermococcus nautili]
MPKPTRRPSEILQWFREHPGEVTSLKALSLNLNIPYNTVFVVVKKLVEEGKLRKVGRGLYTLADEESDADDNRRGGTNAGRGTDASPS